MMKMTTTQSALTIAAALMMSLTACTNDDNIADGTEQPTTVHVTVSAGIGGDGDGTTRAAVVQEGTTRTLTFTAGDRLYIVEELNDGGTKKYLAGYLDMVGTPSADGKSASFSGDLPVYLENGNSSTFDFSGYADQLAAGVTRANLVPAAAPAGFIRDNAYIYPYPYNEAKMIAADDPNVDDDDCVNTLMTSALCINGTYDSSTKSFSLSGRKPILNCTIGHLSKNREYTVKLRYASNQYKYESNSEVYETTYDKTVTTDGNGTARFAISGLKKQIDETNKYDNYYVLQLQGSSTTREYVLGQKELSTKVYNVKKGNHAAVKLTVNVLAEEVGGVVGPGSCDVITIDDGNGNTYSTSGTMLIFEDGKATISFQMQPVSNTKLTVIGTKTTSSGTVIYSGTINSVTLEEFGTYDLSVTLTKGKDLSAGSIIAEDGDFIYQSNKSTPTYNTITIPYGYTVTLVDVNIDKSGLLGTGIICQGSANIVLAGYNSVKGGMGYPAVKAGPLGTLLTISGSGSLTATGGSQAAGIGSGNESDCGNITISGGNVTATGGGGGAGIGSGLWSECGDITISGGNITAMGGSQAAGIGSGNGNRSANKGKCGGITITGGNVTATGGSDAAGIGSGKESDCGNITISGGSGSATKGMNAPYSIGKGVDSPSCGTIAIGTTYYNDGIATSPFTW